MRTKKLMQGIEFRIFNENSARARRMVFKIGGQSHKRGRNSAAQAIQLAGVNGVQYLSCRRHQQYEQQAGSAQLCCRGFPLKEGAGQQRTAWCMRE